MNGVNGWQILQYSEYDLERHEVSAELPRQYAEKILTAGYIKHVMRRVKIIGFWDVWLGGYQCARGTTLFIWMYVLLH